MEPFTDEEIRDAIQKVHDGHPEAVHRAKMSMMEAIQLASPPAAALMLKAFHAVGDLIAANDRATYIARNN